MLLSALVGLLVAVGASAHAEEPVDGVVLVGAPGLAWSDIDPSTTPFLYRLAEEGGVASLTVRSVRSRSCAVDGWLTLSAGRRAADLPGPCREPDVAPGGGAVPHWDDYLAAARAASYGAVPGTLGSALAEHVQCVGAFGPGAAIGAADDSGRVPGSAATIALAQECPVALVDAGTLPVEPGPRSAALRDLDVLVRQVVERVGQQTRVVVAGVGDGPSPVRPRAVLITGSTPGLLTSPSTRQPGLVQLQDLTASTLAWAGAPDPGLTGRPVHVVPDGSPGAARIADLQGFEVRAATLRTVSPLVTAWLAAAFAAWCVVACLCWWRRGEVPTPVLAAGVVVASVPVSTFAANLLPWWEAAAPSTAFVGVLTGVTAVLSALALLAGRRWRLGALLVVSLATLLVLGGDVLTGSGLQLASVFGQNPTVGGRFYGIGNTSYALYGVAVLGVVAILATARWVQAGSVRSARLLPALVLLAAVAIEGLPSLGADFGGPPGLVLGGLVVLAGAAGVRLTVGRVALAVVGVAVLTGVVAGVDWLRPPTSRTHLGEFVQTVLDGGLGEVIGRKLGQNVANLSSPPLLTVSLAALVLGLVAWRTGWAPSRTGCLVLGGTAVLAVVGFAVNDSGLVIPAFAVLVLAPLLVADVPRVAASPPRRPDSAEGADERVRQVGMA